VPIMLRLIMSKNPKNIQAIIDWVTEHRPDLVNYFPLVQSNDAMILLLSVGFEAGRQFQKNNPEFPLDQPTLYLQ
jgi:hypothetical protein